MSAILVLGFPRRTCHTFSTASIALIRQQRGRWEAPGSVSPSAAGSQRLMADQYTWKASLELDRPSRLCYRVQDSKRRPRLVAIFLAGPASCLAERMLKVTGGTGDRSSLAKA